MLGEGSLEVKLPTIWTDEKAEVGRVREEKRDKRKNSERREKSQKTEDAGARKRQQSRETLCFCGSSGLKSRLAKATGAEPSGQMRDDKLHAVVARSIFEVKMYKIHYARTTFGSCDVEKVHTVVVRSTFRSQNVQHPRAGPLFDVAMSKKCTPLRHAAHVEVKNGKLAGTEHFCKS